MFKYIGEWIDDILAIVLLLMLAVPVALIGGVFMVIRQTKARFAAGRRP